MIKKIKFNKCSIKALKKNFIYNPKTGKIKRILKSGRIKNVGSISDNRCLAIFFNNKSYYAHRMAWALYYGKWPVKLVDHKNRNSLDNRICNLREASHAQNAFNAICGYGKNKTRGITKFRNKYIAYTKINKKVIRFGAFDNIKEAKECWIKNAKKYHGNFFCDGI